MSNYIISNGELVSESELYHHGVKGMKWGVRRSYARNIYRKGKKIHSKGDPADHSGIGVHTKFVREPIDNKAKAAAKAKRIDNKAQKRLAKAMTMKELARQNNKLADQINPKIEEFNKKWEGKYNTKEYIKAYASECNKILGDIKDVPVVKTSKGKKFVRAHMNDQLGLEFKLSDK